MQEQVIVMSAEQYFKKYAVDGIGKGADRWMIKRQLIDAFRKEIFGLVSMRTKKQLDGIYAEGDPEAERIARNVIHDATRKWIKLCGMFAKYKETAGLINEKDLKLYDELEDEEDVGSPEEVGETEGTGEASDDPGTGEPGSADREAN